jgi:transposase
MDVVQTKRPEMWNSGCWLFHHDTVPAHTALLIRQFLAKHSIPTLAQPPYSSDLSPPDIFHSLNSKLPLKEDFRHWKMPSLMRRIT